MKSTQRKGFILMQVVVAITLLALILTPLAGMVFKITARSHRATGGSYRNGVLMQDITISRQSRTTAFRQAPPLRWSRQRLFLTRRPSSSRSTTRSGMHFSPSIRHSC